MMATARALKRDGKAAPEVAIAAGDGSGRGERRLAERAAALFQERREHGLRRMDRMFLFLMLGQWVFAILIAGFFSPYCLFAKFRLPAPPVTPEQRLGFREVRIGHQPLRGLAPRATLPNHSLIVE
jgi:hypothetical protein